MNKKNNNLIGIIAVCISAALWGLDGVILTPRLYNLNVSAVVFLIHLVPFAIMSIFLHKEFRKLTEFTKNDFLYFSLISLFGGLIGTLSIVKALFLVNFDGLSVIVLLQKLQPVFAILLAYIILKEKIARHKYVWAGVAIVSSYFLTFGLNLPNLQGGSDIIYASAFSLMAAFSFGSSTVFGKKVLGRYDFRTSTFYRFFFTTVLALLYIIIFERQAAVASIASITMTNVVIILIIAFTTGSGAIFLYYYGLTRIKASISTICELCFPVSVILLDYLINGKLLSPVQIIAVAVISFAIYMMGKDGSAKQIKESNTTKQ